MRRRASMILLLLGWFFSTGCQWDLLQTFAWGRMFVGYAHSMSVLEAFQMTFSGDECDLCSLVNDATHDRESDSRANTQTLSETRIPLAPLPSALFASPPRIFISGRAVPVPLWSDRDRTEPLSPPPRAVA